MFGKIVGIILKNFVKKVNAVAFYFSSAEEDAFLEEAILEDLLYPYNSFYRSRGGNAEEIGGRTFQTGGKTMSRRGLSKIEKRLISTAAAVAAGCKPCTAITISHAREVGASEEEIKRAVTIGLEVKRQACDEMQQEAQKHLDISIHGAFPGEITATTKTEWLIATGAAFAANSTFGLEHYSAAAEQLGATAPNLTMALEIARHVKEQAGTETDKITVMIAPIKMHNRAVPGACGCVGEEQSMNCGL